MSRTLHVQHVTCTLYHMEEKSCVQCNSCELCVRLCVCANSVNRQDRCITKFITSGSRVRINLLFFFLHFLCILFACIGSCKGSECGEIVGRSLIYESSVQRSNEYPSLRVHNRYKLMRMLSCAKRTHLSAGRVFGNEDYIFPRLGMLVTHCRVNRFLDLVVQTPTWIAHALLSFEL